jgi:hypothetical protein
MTMGPGIPAGRFRIVRAGRNLKGTAMRRLGILLVVYGVGVAVVAILGPLLTGVIRYRVVEAIDWQITGGDIAALFLVSPAAIVAGWLLVNRHPGGAVLAIAPTAFGVYTYMQLALGGEFGVQPGNGERFFLLFLGMFLLAGIGLIGAWSRVEGRQLPEPGGALRRVVATVVLVLAGFLTLGLHLPGLIDITGGEPYDPAYMDSPTVYWVVTMMDLGIVVPAAIAAGVGLIRRTPWAAKVMYAVIGWGALLGSAVAGMAIVMQINDDPTASLASSIVFTSFAVAFVALAFVIYRPVLTTGRSAK